MSRYYAIMITGCTQPESLENILAYVSRSFNVPATKIQSRSRVRKVVDAKALFCAIAYRTGRFSLNEIGEFLKLHHATVIHHRRECVENYTMSRMARPIVTNFFGEYRRDPSEMKNEK